MNYVSYFYTKQLHTLGGMYLIFSLSVSFVISYSRYAYHTLI